jgi:hypothetical protein
MKRMIIWLIIIALAVAGYQVYKDDSKRTALEEKVKGVLYSIGDSVYVNDNTGVSSSEKIRTDLQPYVDKLVKEYPYKDIKLVLNDGVEIDIQLKKAFVTEVVQSNNVYKKGDLIFYIQQENIVNPKNKLDQKILNKYSTEVSNVDDVYLIGNILKFKQKELFKDKSSLMGYLTTPAVRGIFTFILSDELLKYVPSSSPIYLNVINSPLIPYSNCYKGYIIKASTDKIFNNKEIYVESYFQYKDGKFYEIKRESNVKEYVEWAKKNL